MDPISYSYADKAHKRIKKFINDPDSSSGIITVPKVIASGETVTVPAGRVAVLPGVQVDGTMTVNGEVFIPSGSSYSDTNIDSTNAVFDTLKVQGQNVSPYSGFKNYLINGNFDIWQRGVGPFTNYAYGADRWVSYHTTATMNSSSTSSNGIQKRIAHIQNVTAGSNFLAQAIELPLIGFGHPFTVGKKFTVSIRYSSTTKIRPSLIFRDGVVGSNSVNLDSTMTSAPYKGGSGVDETVSWTFTVDGAAVGTNNCLVLAIASESVASNVYVYQVQLEEGATATPFEQRPAGLELSLCQRYFEVLGVTSFHGYGSAGNGFWNQHEMRVTKRVAPTISVGAITSQVNCGIGTMVASTDIVAMLITVTTTGAFIADVSNVRLAAEL